MTHESLWNDDWGFIVKTLGGPAALDCLARKTGAFMRSRQVKTAEDLLRLCFAYGPGQMSLRSASAWAEAVGLAKFSDVALMERLQKSGDWLAALIGRALLQEVPQAALDRPIRPPPSRGQACGWFGGAQGRSEETRRQRALAAACGI